MKLTVFKSVLPDAESVLVCLAPSSEKKELLLREHEDSVSARDGRDVFAPSEDRLRSPVAFAFVFMVFWPLVQVAGWFLVPLVWWAGGREECADGRRAVFLAG